MRIAKLIFFFILIVGNIVLLFNLGTIFGNKQYPAQQLSETDRVGIFTELLKDTIDSDEFYRSDEAKKIVDRYNELSKKAQEAERLAEDAVTRAQNAARRAEAAAQRAEVAETYKDAEAAAQEVSDALSTVEDIAKQYPSEDIDRVKIRVKAAVIRAEEVIKKNKEQQKNKIDQIKAEILELVKKKDLNGCRNHPGWKTLKWEDRVTVESLLDTGQYYRINKKTGNREYSEAAARKIKAYIEKLDFNSFKTWKDLENAQLEIMRINRNSK